MGEMAQGDQSECLSVTCWGNRCRSASSLDILRGNLGE